MSTEPGAVLLRETLRGGQMWSRVLKRGQRLRLVDLEGRAALAALFFNSEQFLERYNMPDTLKAQHIARLTRGNCLFSDMGRVLCSIVEDGLGWHDTVTGIQDARGAHEKYGEGNYQELRNDFFRNSTDNLLVELGKYGLGKRDLSPGVNFFVKVVVDMEGNLSWVSAHSRPGASVVLRSDMNTLLVLSNTPHPLDPSARYAPGPVALELSSGTPAGPDDACRKSCGEAERAFRLTENYFA